MSPKDIPDDETRTKIADELSVLLDVDRDKLLEQTQKTNSQYEVVKAKIELPSGIPWPSGFRTTS